MKRRYQERWELPKVRKLRHCVALGVLVALATSSTNLRAEPSAKREQAAKPVLWPAYVGVGLAITGVVGGVVFTGQALDDAESARDLYPTDPRYVEARDRFSTDRFLAIGSFAVASLGIAFATYWTISRTSRVQVTALGDDGVMVSIRHTR